MLPKEAISQPDAVEKYFCEPFEKLKLFEMDKDTTEMLVFLLGKVEQIEIPEKEKPFLVKVIEARVKGCFTYAILDTRLVIFIACISEVPGTAIMYLTYLQYWCKKNNIKEVDLDDFCKIFGDGFPSKQDLHELWDNTKVQTVSGRTGNLIDFQYPMQSIQFLTEQQQLTLKNL